MKGVGKGLQETPILSEGVALAPSFAAFRAGNVGGKGCRGLISCRGVSAGNRPRLAPTSTRLTG